MADNVFDAIVVGSGISGGWAAKELTEKGLKVLLLERGEDIPHVSGYTSANKHPWEFPHRGGKTQEMVKAYPVLNRDYPLNETNLNYWTNEKDCPYVEKKRFDWFRGYHVGGRSLMWGRQSYRWSDIDFEANAKEGIAVDWPIRYKDIAPWYDYVEGFAGISGSKEGLEVLPDGNFQPPMELNCVEKDVAAKIKDHYKGQRNLLSAVLPILPNHYPEEPIASTAINAGWVARLVLISARNLQRCLPQKQPVTSRCKPIRSLQKLFTIKTHKRPRALK